MLKPMVFYLLVIGMRIGISISEKYVERADGFEHNWTGSKGHACDQTHDKHTGHLCEEDKSLR